MSNKRKTIIVITIIVGLVLCVLALNTYMQKKLEKERKVAAVKGLAIGKEECLKEQQKHEVCNNLKVYAQNWESGGEFVWMVYVDAQNQYDYSATVTLDGDYKLKEYFRNTHEPL